MTGAFEERAYSVERLALEFDASQFRLSATGLLSNDGKYEAELFSGAPGGKMLGNYILMEQGGVEIDLDGLSFRFGRFRHYDEIDSPYALFVNSTGLPANIMEIRWDDGFFTYQSRWVELNYRSSMNTPAWKEADGFSGFPDRGANIKTYALSYGALRFGLQDAAVYTGRNFDFEYFASPIPQYFIQYVKSTGGRPWTTGWDENNMIGFFIEKTPDQGFSWYGQFFFEDGNLHWLSDSFPDLPWKAAWAVGASLPAPWGGRLAAHVAGATMYAFGPITSTSLDSQVEGSYGYSYYPDTRFDKEGELVPIRLEDAMVGYKHGENNAALDLAWSGRAAGFDAAAGLELRVAGSASPANPWHEDWDNNVVTSHYLDESVLETRIFGTATLGRRYGPLSLDASMGLGFVWNERALAPVPGEGTLPSSPLDNFVWIWKPAPGADRFLFTARMMATYRFEVRRP